MGFKGGVKNYISMFSWLTHKKEEEMQQKNRLGRSVGKSIGGVGCVEGTGLWGGGREGGEGGAAVAGKEVVVGGGGLN